MPKKRPQKLLKFRCSDKDNHELWSENRDMLNITRPYRAVLCGPPGSSKTSVIKSLLCCADPLFERGWLWHPDPNAVTEGEYQDCGLELLKDNKLPPTKFWFDINPDKKHMVLVIDDVDVSELRREQKSLFDRLVSTASTHCSLTILLASQVFFNLPTVCRKTANLFVLYKPISEEQDLKAISKRVGLPADTLSELFHDHCPNRTDSVWIDLTPESPYPVRINGTKLMRKVEKYDNHKK